MPWNQVKPMDQRILFLADYLRQADSIAELSRRYGISRKTAHKWIKRYREDGIDGLNQRFSKPLSHPTKTPYRIEKEIITQRKLLLTKPGPKKLQVLLKEKFPDAEIPSKTTIYNILKRAGLIDPQPRRRKSIPPSGRPFGPVHNPNDLWSVDYKGQFRLGNGKSCYPLTIMDHESRFLLSCEGLSGTALKETQAVFARLFDQHGLPLRIRSDNGTPFSSTSCAGLSKLSIWWIRLGITPERIEPGKPQQNGQHERMHRTMKQAVCKPPSTNMAQQQKRFDTFQQEYNEIRPHESLNQQTPSSCYVQSSRMLPNKLPNLEYPGHYEVLKIHQNGVFYWGNKCIYTSALLKNEYVALNEIKDGVWSVFFGSVLLGCFDERDSDGKTQGYISLKQ